MTSLHAAGVVFTRDGKPISKALLRRAFDAAQWEAMVKDFHFHDFRHCAVTGWTLAGIRDELYKFGAGSSRRSALQCFIDPLGEQWSRFSPKIFAGTVTTLRHSN